MPKVIKDIEKKIFNSAMDLFGEYGYQQVNMSSIAENAGIAVGTLYNYYPNKKKLFMDVLKMSWSITIYKLDLVINEHVVMEEKLYNFIKTAYEEFTSRKGLGHELLRESMNKKDILNIFENIREKMIKKLILLINEIEKEWGLKFTKEMEERFVEMIFFNIAMLSNEHPEEKEKNIDFIIQLIKCCSQ